MKRIFGRNMPTARREKDAQPWSRPNGTVSENPVILSAAKDLKADTSLRSA
jgi:hypothetical protein